MIDDFGISYEIASMLVNIGPANGLVPSGTKPRCGKCNYIQINNIVSIFLVAALQQKLWYSDAPLNIFPHDVSK